MATSPIFVATPKFTNTIVNNTNGGDPAYSTPTTVATLLTMAAAGRIDNVYITPVGTNAATSVRLWVDTVGTGGVANKLVKDLTAPATTSATTSALTSIQWSPGLVLPVNAVLRATVANTAVTNGVCISVEYVEF